ncbi:MAG: endolytic transglycosylase MltG [Bacteroidetes bacterium]|nr:endolytic transglycosylase MltG [Bacteroidota bacterium]
MRNMKSLRRKIDRADKRIVKLLNKRAGYADDIGKIKEKLGLEIYSPEREKQVIDNVCRENPGPLTDEAVRRVYERIIDESRRLERESAEERRVSMRPGEFWKSVTGGSLQISGVDLRQKKNLALLAASALAAFLLFLFVVFVTPYHEAQGKGVVVTIEHGASAEQVFSQLARDNLITNRILFKLAARLLSMDHEIKAGKYIFAGHFSDYDVLNLIASGKSNLFVTVTVPEGLTVKQIASIYHREVGVDSLRFVQEALGDSMATILNIPSKNLEGYLFPQTYDFYYGTPASEIIRRMADQFKSFFNDSLRSRAVETGYSVSQIMKIASIVEAEARVDSERPIIASVYYNRLRKGIPLEADPTIEYAMGEHTRIYYKDLRINSPYNTYERVGLPPTPICNPGEKSILAALYPDTTKYLFFVATGTGGHRFSDTYREHLRAVKAYRKAMMRE